MESWTDLGCTGSSADVRTGRPQDVEVASAPVVAFAQAACHDPDDLCIRQLRTPRGRTIRPALAFAVQHGTKCATPRARQADSMSWPCPQYANNSQPLPHAPRVPRQKPYIASCRDSPSTELKYATSSQPESMCGSGSDSVFRRWMLCLRVLRSVAPFPHPLFIARARLSSTLAGTHETSQPGHPSQPNCRPRNAPSRKRRLPWRNRRSRYRSTDADRTGNWPDVSASNTVAREGFAVSLKRPVDAEH